MDTDAHGSERERDEVTDDLTGAVIGAMFEVANVLGSGFLERVYERALMPELALRQIPGFVPGLVQGAVCWRVPGGFSSAREAHRRTEMLRPVLERTPGAMHQLSEGFPSRSRFYSSTFKSRECNGNVSYRTGEAFLSVCIRCPWLNPRAPTLPQIRKRLANGAAGRRAVLALVRGWSQNKQTLIKSGVALRRKVGLLLPKPPLAAVL